MRNFKWSNFPIPEGHVITLIISVALHIWLPLSLSELSWLKYVAGWPILLSGILLSTWAVMTVGNMDISKSTKIIISGPYSFSRNPMYVSWTMIYIGIAILVNTWWPILLLPALLAFVHFLVVRKEEKQLEQKFGEEYLRYSRRVRRYL